MGEDDEDEAMNKSTLQVPPQIVQVTFPKNVVTAYQGLGWKLPSWQRLVIPDASPYKTQTRQIESLAIPLVVSQNYINITSAFNVPTESVTFLDIYLNTQLVFTTAITTASIVKPGVEHNVADQVYVGTVYENLQNPLVTGDPATLELGAHGVIAPTTVEAIMEMTLGFNMEVVGHELVPGNGSINYTDVDRYPEVVPVKIV